MQQALEAVPRTPSEYIYTLEASWNQSDQVESQGLGEATEGGSPVEELVEALPFCDGLDVFTAVIEPYSLQQVEDAIALQDTQSRRQELRVWWVGLQQQKESRVEGAVRLLREAIQHGADTLHCVLRRWSSLERWEAILTLEEKSLEDMQRLIAISPNWVELCDVAI
jgi:hypothetical protein